MNWSKFRILIALLASPASQAQSFEVTELIQASDNLQLSTAQTHTPNDTTQFLPPRSLEADLYYVQTTGSVGKYIAGGVLGTWLGFGLGHKVNGTWPEIGWVFTFGEIIAAGAITTGVAMAGGDLEQLEEGKISTSMVISGAIAFGGLRIWETADVWLRPVIKGYRGQSSARSQALSPVAGTDATGVVLRAEF